MGTCLPQLVRDQYWEGRLGIHVLHCEHHLDAAILCCQRPQCLCFGIKFGWTAVCTLFRAAM